VRVEKKGKLAGKIIHIQTAINGSLNIGNGIGKGKRHLLNRGRAGFTDVIPGNTDRVPMGDFCLTVTERIGYQAQ